MKTVRKTGNFSNFESNLWDLTPKFSAGHFWDSEISESELRFKKKLRIFRIRIFRIPLYQVLLVNQVESGPNWVRLIQTRNFVFWSSILYVKTMLYCLSTASEKRSKVLYSKVFTCEIFIKRLTSLLWRGTFHSQNWGNRKATFWPRNFIDAFFLHEYYC